VSEYPNNPVAVTPPQTLGGIIGTGRLNTGLGTISRSITVALSGHGGVDVASIAADGFGNAIGNAIAGQIGRT